MPGNVVVASPSLVMPKLLTNVWQQQLEYAANVNEFRNGESIRDVLVDDTRRSWKLGFPLTPDQWAALLAFYRQVGQADPFFFYDPWESTVFGNFDESGSDEDGRFTVCFRSTWKQSKPLTRTVVSDLALIEVA